MQVSEELGCVEYAERAQALYIKSQSYNSHADELPDGWALIGEGMSRRVYLAPDGICYKVIMNNGYCRQGSNANESEAMAYAALKDLLPSHIRLARCFVWSSTVSAMEYVAGNDNGYGYRPEAVSELIRIASDHGFTIRDLHPGNVRFSNGILTAIDYAL